MRLSTLGSVVSFFQQVVMANSYGMCFSTLLPPGLLTRIIS